MSTLVVQAHPAERSYGAALFEAIGSELDKQPGQFRALRLAQGDQLTADVFESVERLIAVYPTWYGSLPAVFLAQLADVLTPWIDANAPAETSPLRSVRSLKVVTSHGSSKLVNMIQGEPGMQLWKRAVLPLCAPKATFEWKALYKLDRNNDATRAAFMTEAAHFAATPTES